MQLFKAHGKFLGSFAALLSFFMEMPYALAPRVDINTEQGFREVTLLPNGNVCADIKGDQRRQELINTLVEAWQHFGHQVYDLSSKQTYDFPGGEAFSILPDEMNPWRDPKVVPRMLRVGAWEDNRRMDVAIGSFWATLPEGETFLTRQNAIWAINDNAGWADAWSAAFVSWAFCESGIPMADFMRNQSHYMYVDDALREESPLYKALDIEEAGVPQIGDMICADRQKTETYQTLADRLPDMGTARPLHCDVVVQRDLNKNRVFVIGGNVGNSVTLTALRLKDGKLERTKHRPWFTVLRWQGGGSASFEKAIKELRTE